MNKVQLGRACALVALAIAFCGAVRARAPHEEGAIVEHHASGPQAMEAVIAKMALTPQWNEESQRLSTGLVTDNFSRLRSHLKRDAWLSAALRAAAVLAAVGEPASHPGRGPHSRDATGNLNCCKRQQHDADIAALGDVGSGCAVYARCDHSPRRQQPCAPLAGDIDPDGARRGARLTKVVFESTEVRQVSKPNRTENRHDLNVDAITTMWAVSQSAFAAFTCIPLLATLGPSADEGARR